MRSVLLTFMITAITLGPASGADKPPAIDKAAAKKAEKTIRDFLAKHKASAGTVELLDDEAVLRIMGKWLVFGVRFPTKNFFNIPAGMGSSNVIIVPPTGKMIVLKGSGDITTFYKRLLATTDSRAKDLAQVYAMFYALISLEGGSDYKLKKDSASVTTQNRARTAKATVVANWGDKFELTAELRFDVRGRLASAKTSIGYPKAAPGISKDKPKTGAK